MKWVAPLGPVYQAGTLSGNPLAVVAGLTTLQMLKKRGTYEKLESISSALVSGLAKAADGAGCPVQINRIGSMFTVFFSANPVTDYESARAGDAKRYSKFFQAMLAKGVYLAPSQFESCFVSLAHTQKDINATVRAAKAAFRIAVEED